MNKHGLVSSSSLTLINKAVNTSEPLPPEPLSHLVNLLAPLSKKLSTKIVEEPGIEMIRKRIDALISQASKLPTICPPPKDFIDKMIEEMVP